MEIDSSTKVAGHRVKRPAVAACGDGRPEGRAIRIDDSESTIFEGKTTGNGPDETGQTTRQDQKSQRRSVTANDAVQCLGKQMQDVQKPG